MYYLPNVSPMVSRLTAMMFFLTMGFALQAQTGCGDLQVQVNVTHNTSYLAHEGAYSVVLSGVADTFTIVAESGELCVEDEYFCQLFGGSYCDLIHCEETFEVILPDDSSEVTAVSFTALPAGEYFFTITNNDGCLLTQSAEVTEPPCNMTMDFTITGTTSPYVNDGTIAISTDNGTGNVLIRLLLQNEQFGYDQVDSLYNDGIFLNLARGHYLIDATDEVGCFSQDYTDIPGDFCDVSLGAGAITSPSLNGLADGAIDISGMSSYPPVTAGVMVLFGSTDYFELPHTFTGLYGGEIIFIAYDSAGCVTEDTFLIPIPSCALQVVSSVETATNQMPNGSISVVVSNGIAPFAVLLFDDNNLMLDSVVTPGPYVFTNLLPGDYSLLIKEIDDDPLYGIPYYGCDTTLSIAVTNQNMAGDCLINASIAATDEENGYDGSIAVDATSANGDVTVNLHSGLYVSDYPNESFLNSGQFSGLTGGFYTIEMRDSSGCRRHDEFFLNYQEYFQPCGDAEIIVTIPSAFEATDGSVTVTVANPNFYGMVLYDVGNGQTYEIIGDGTFSNLGVGNYYLTIYSYEGGLGSCGTQYLYLLPDYCNGFSFNAVATDESVFGLADGQIEVVSANMGDPAAIRLYDPNYGGNLPDGYIGDYRPEILTAQGVFGEITGGNYGLEFTYEGGCYRGMNLNLECGPYDSTYYLAVAPTPGNSDGSLAVIPVPGSPYEYGFELYSDNDYFGMHYGAHTFENLPASNYYLYVYTFHPQDINHYYYLCYKDIQLPLGVADCSNSTYDFATTDVTTYNGNDGTITVTTSGFNGDAYITLNGDCEGEIATLQMDPQMGSELSLMEIPQGIVWDESGKKTVETDPLFRTGENPGDTLINTGTFSNLAAGDYHVCINDLYGCEYVQYFSIGSANCEIMTNINSVQPTANAANGSITVTADIENTMEDAHIFIIRENYGVINDGFNEVSAFNLTEGTYFINIFGDNGSFCYRYDTLVLDDGLNCDINIEVTGFTHVSTYGASDGTISVAASSSFGDVTMTLVGQTVINAGSFTGLGPGSYLVTGVDEAGCTATSNGTYFISSPQCGLELIVDVDLPNPGYSNGAIHINTIGVGDSVYIQVQIPSITGPLTIASGVNQMTVDSLYSFYYNIIAYTSDYQYCNEGAGIFLPEAPCVLNAFATGFDASTPFSNDGYIIAGANGGTGLYTFSGPGNQTDYNTFSDLAPGIYSIQATDITGCSASVEVSVSAPGCFELAVVTEDVTEYGGTDGSVVSYMVDGVSTGNILYDLLKDGEYFAGQVNSGTFAGLGAGSYTLFAEDEIGCSDVISFVINQPDCSLAINAIPVPVSLHGGSDGSIDVVASGGLGNLSIQLLTPTMTSVGPLSSPALFDSLPSGIYQVIVADEVSCADTLVVEITETPCALTAEVEADSIAVYGGNDGSITASASGGIPPYLYELYQGGIYQDAQTSEGAVAFGMLPAGDYTVEISDQGGCDITVGISIGEPDCQILLSVSAVPSSHFGANNGEILASATGGIALYSIQITGEDNLPLFQFVSEGEIATFSALAPGDYAVAVTDQAGCTQSATVTVTEPSCEPVVFYQDADGDGMGNPQETILSCMMPPGYVSNNTDCDDNNPHPCPRPVNTATSSITDVSAVLGWTGNSCASRYRLEYRQKTNPASPWIVIYVTSTSYTLTGLMEGTQYQWRVGTVCVPGGTSVPNGFTVQLTFKTMRHAYPDLDLDGFGDAFSGTVLVPNLPALGYAADNTDCNDNHALVHPNAVEICNGVDDNCDMLVDNDVLLFDWYQDSDGDGLGNPDSILPACLQPMGYVSNDLDCDDNNAAPVCAAPADVMADNITPTTAEISWSEVPCAFGYTLQYRQLNPNSAWSTKVNLGPNAFLLTGLSANTTYQVRVRSRCPAPNPAIISAWTFFTFVTPSLPMGLVGSLEGTSEAANPDELMVYPNPGRGDFQLRLEANVEESVVVQVTDGFGKTWRQVNWMLAEGLNLNGIDLTDLVAGVYHISIQTADRLYSKKVIILK